MVIMSMDLEVLRQLVYPLSENSNLDPRTACIPFMDPEVLYNCFLSLTLQLRISFIA